MCCIDGGLLTNSLYCDDLVVSNNVAWVSAHSLHSPEHAGHELQLGHIHFRAHSSSRAVHNCWHKSVAVKCTSMSSAEAAQIMPTTVALFPSCQFAVSFTMCGTEVIASHCTRVHFGRPKRAQGVMSGLPVCVLRGGTLGTSNLTLTLFPDYRLQTLDPKSWEVLLSV